MTYRERSAIFDYIRQYFSLAGQRQKLVTALDT
jgi:hypothetical protein